MGWENYVVRHFRVAWVEGYPPGTHAAPTGGRGKDFRWATWRAATSDNVPSGAPRRSYAAATQRPRRPYPEPLQGEIVAPGRPTSSWVDAVWSLRGRYVEPGSPGPMGAHPTRLSPCPESPVPFVPSRSPAARSVDALASPRVSLPAAYHLGST